jgi:hypothetical protein
MEMTQTISPTQATDLIHTLLHTPTLPQSLREDSINGTEVR